MSHRDQSLHQKHRLEDEKRGDEGVGSVVEVVPIRRVEVVEAGAPREEESWVACTRALLVHICKCHPCCLRQRFSIKQITPRSQVLIDLSKGTQLSS